MKVYTVMAFEMGVLNSFNVYKNKKDAIDNIHHVVDLFEDDYQKLIENGYYSDDNGYEVYFRCDTVQ